MTRALSSRIERLEGVQGPGHRHNPVVRVSPWEDAAAKFAEAIAECERHGCKYGLMLLPEMISPDAWGEVVQSELLLINDIAREHE